MEQNNTDRLKHSAGTFKASAEGAGIKWKYRDQEVTSSICNFTIDDTDSNVYLMFDKAAKVFTCKMDDNLLLDLSDLNGKDNVCIGPHQL